MECNRDSIYVEFNDRQIVWFSKGKSHLISLVYWIALIFLLDGSDSPKPDRTQGEQCHNPR